MPRVKSAPSIATILGRPTVVSKQPGAKESAPATTRRHRWRSGTVALREIRKQQRSTNLIFPRASFERLVREIAESYKSDVRFTGNAIEAIQQAAEDDIVGRFGDVSILAYNQGRLTINDKMWNIAKALRSGWEARAVVAANTGAVMIERRPKRPSKKSINAADARRRKRARDQAVEQSAAATVDDRAEEEEPGPDARAD